MANNPDLTNPINNNQSTAQNFNQPSSSLENSIRQLLKSNEKEFNNYWNTYKRLLIQQEEQTQQGEKQLQRLQEQQEKVNKKQQEIDAVQNEIREIEITGIGLARLEGLRKEKEALEQEQQGLGQVLDGLNDALEQTNSDLEKINDGLTEIRDTFNDANIDMGILATIDSAEQIFDQTTDLLETKKKEINAQIAAYNNKLKEATEAHDFADISEIQVNLDELYTQLNNINLELADVANQADEYKGHTGKRASTRLEQMFGKEVGGSLNWLGNMDNILGRGIGNILDTVQGTSGGAIGNLQGLLFDRAQAAEDRGEEYDSTDTMLDMAESISEAVAPELVPIVEGVKAVKGVLETIGGVVNAMNNKMGQYIDQAAEALKSYYGAIGSNLYGYATYQDIADLVDNTLGGNTLIRQTDYLSQIATLSAQGIARDVEAAALLSTIKDRTLTQFDVSNESLRRLIRLGQDQVYQSQFGLELQLKKVLNSTFKDSGYLSSLFDSVRDAIMDASVAQTGDITSFNSLVQTWMGSMYSTGLSSNVINQIAQGINALGSGNVQALAADEATQRLFLLAMDRVGLDYADILQQGLSLDDTNKLFVSMVNYLDEITTNTSDNLVLKSSYGGLFNMSVTDMQAIHNLASQADSIANNAVDTANALTMTQNAVTNMVSANTSIAEKWDNFFANFQYAMGANIAESSGLYNTWRVSSIVENLANSVVNNPLLGKTAAGGIAKAAGVVSALIKAGISVSSIISEVGNLHPFAGSESMLLQLLNTGVEGGNISTAISTGGSSNTYSRTSLKNSSMFTNVSKNVSEAESQASGWSDDSDVVNKVLGEMEKTIMKLNEGDGYAFAVSLEGMNNNVLRSFASIFADEDKMLETFQGDNKVITDVLFGYMDSNTSKDSSKSSSTTTTTTKKA